MPGAKITKIKFYSINRDVRAAVAAANYDAEEIGRKHFVSRETVNAVRRAGTWPQWERNKAEANRRRVQRARKSINVPPVAPVTNDVEVQEEDLVTIPRAQFYNFVGLEKRVKKIEKRLDDEGKGLYSQPIQMTVTEPKPRRRLWSKR